MNYKKALYSALSRLLFWLLYPARLILNSSYLSDHVLIYVIARLNGYSKESAFDLVKQANLESAYLTSNARMKANNIFGMMMPRVRETTATGTIQLAEGTFASYDSIADAVLDRILWDEYNSIEPNNGLYKEYVLSNGYATDPHYLAKWKDTHSRLPAHIDKIALGTVSMLALMVVLGFRYLKRYEPF